MTSTLRAMDLDCTSVLHRIARDAPEDKIRDTRFATSVRALTVLRSIPAPLADLPPGVTARLPESLFAAPRLWCEPPLSDAARPPALLPLDLLPDLRSSSSWWVGSMMEDVRVVSDLVDPNLVRTSAEARPGAGGQELRHRRLRSEPGARL